MKPDLLESLREQYPPDGMARLDDFLIGFFVGCAGLFALLVHLHRLGVI